MKCLLLGVGAIGIFVLAVSIVSAQAPQGQARGQGQQVQGQGQPQGAQPGQGRGAGGAGGGGGQAGGRGPAPPTNLQVLPKETTGQQILPIMQAFNGALGVQCNYCHVTAQDAPAAGGRGRGQAAGGDQAGRGAAPAPMNDFASDAKPTKRTARTMMLMARDVKANIEFNSNSARSYQQMSVAYQRKNDRENAIKSLEKAVELDPMNMGFRNQLNNLRNPPVTAQE